MPTKHVRNAMDLARFRCGLKIECRRCGYAVTFDAMELMRSVGQTTFESLQGRLMCSRCGKKNAELIVLTPLPMRG